MPSNIRLSLMNMIKFAEILQDQDSPIGSYVDGENVPLISQTVNQLEQSLDIQLFESGSPPQQLTAAGERILESCQRILAELKSLEQHLSDQPNSLTGNISISAPVDISRQCICPLLELFSSQHPEITIELLVNDPIGNINWSTVDLIICIGPQSDSRLTALKLALNQQMVCAAPSYIEDHGYPQTPNDLQNHQCLILNHAHHWRFSQADSIFEIPVTGYRHTNDGEILRQWAVAGAGIAIKSIWEVQADLTAKQLIPLLTEYTIPVGALYTVFPRQQRLPERCRRLINFLQEELAEQAKRLKLIY